MKKNEMDSDMDKLEKTVIFYHIDKSVLVENSLFLKFIRNYIRHSSGVFSISSLVRISMTSFLAFTLLFVQIHSCLYHSKTLSKIKFISSRRRVISFM